jgi:hypothetical protein
MKELTAIAIVKKGSLLKFWSKQSFIAPAEEKRSVISSSLRSGRYYLQLLLKMRPRLFFAWYKQVSWDRFNQNCMCAVTSTVAYYVLRSELIGLNGRRKRELLNRRTGISSGSSEEKKTEMESKCKR